MDASIAHNFDLRALPPGFYEDPYPSFAALRRHAPVQRQPDGSYLLTRHADLFAIYRDTATFSSDKQVEFTPKFGAGSPLLAHHTNSLIFNDPPLHTRVRRLITGALTPRAVAAMEPGVVALVDGLLDAMAAKGPVVDLIPDFAAAIPIEVIGNLLAIPHADRAPLRDWSLDILGALEPAPTAAMLQRGNRSVEEFCAYLAALVADRRRHPGDAERDVLTRLIAGEADGERLSEQELLQNCIFILNAGHETTTNAIAAALALLDRNPEQRARLLAEPELIRTGVEEVLRYEPSVQLGNRRTLAPCTLSGVALPAGALLTLCIAGANRDPEAFDRPGVFDLARRPNPHLAFAGGAHVCAGVSVARLEMRLAIGMFLRRFPRYALHGTPVRDLRARFRGYRSLPARLEV